MTKRLTRSKDSMIAGVCGGIANYFDLDPTVVRLLYILLSVVSIGFPGVICYIIMMLVIPAE
ncbi:MAG: PspC domain-containing protein [Cyclobacteriaceae bacterium]